MLIDERNKKDRVFLGKVLSVDPETQRCYIEWEAPWPNAEYATPLGEVLYWRQLFLNEIAKQAPRALLELARLLNSWVRIGAIENAISGADGLKDKRPEGALPNLIRLKPKYLNTYAYQLRSWLIRYGLSQNRRGDMAKWVLEEVVLNTYEFWLERHPGAKGKSFAPLGIPIANPLENVMANPHLLTSYLNAATPEEQESWKEKQEIYRQAVGDASSLIVAPLGFDPWIPHLEREKDYLNRIKKTIHTRTIIDPMLSYSPGGHRESFMNGIVAKLKDNYCRKLRKYYEANGYKKLPQKPSAEKHIDWTVQVQVLGHSFAAIKRKEENEGSQYTVPAIRNRVHEILKLLDLLPRRSISQGRPRGSRNSALSPHRPGPQAHSQNQ